MKTLFSFTETTLKMFDAKMKSLGYEYNGTADDFWFYTNPNNYDYNTITIQVGNSGVVGVIRKNRWTGSNDLFQPQSVKNQNQFFNFIKDLVK